VIFQRGTHRFGHWRARTGLRPLESRVTPVRQAKEVEHLVIDRSWIGEEVSAFHDVDTLTAEEALQALELVNVVPIRPVGVVAEAVADIGRVGRDALGLSLEPPEPARTAPSRSRGPHS